MITDYALTATDVAALRKADAVCFDLYHRDGDTTSQMRAIKRAPEPSATNPFPVEITVNVPVTPSVKDYGAEHYGVDFHGYTCFEMIHSARYSDEWQTIAGLLRAGDEITLHWQRDGGNGYITEAGLHIDVLKLIIKRKSAKGASGRLTFIVDELVCQDNSARMIKLNQYSLR